MILWLKRLFSKKPYPLEDIIIKKYIQHPMLRRTNEYSKNLSYWINYYENAGRKSELQEFGKAIDKFL